MPASLWRGPMINGQTDPRPTSAGPGAVIAANAAPTRDRTEADTEVVGTRGLTLDLGHAESGRGRGSENDPRSRPARTTWRSSAAGLLICIGRLRVRRCAGAQLRAQVAAVETENAELETERDILRQAAKYFAGETNW